MPQKNITVQHILICEDDPTFQEELLRVLGQTFKDAHIGCFSEPDAALQYAKDTPPDLVLMDLYFFGQAYMGVETLEKVSLIAPDSRRVVFTAHIPHDPELYRLWKAGLHGYFLKNARLKELTPKLERILKGQRIYDWMVENRLCSMPTYRPEPEPEVLSERQKEVMIMIAQGLSLEEISQNLNINYSSARVHRNRVFDKLSLNSDVDIVRYCYRHRLIEH